MKSCLFAFALVVLSGSTAFCDEIRFYLSGDLGGSLVQGTHATLRRAAFPGPPASSGRIEFDPGARVGFTAGYALNNYLSAEAELGGFVSPVHGGNGRDWEMHDGTLANVPLLFNLKVQYPNRSHWTPFVGGGVGVAASILDATLLSAGAPLSSFVRADGTQADAVFAWQAFTGVAYKLGERNEIALQYRYFVIGEPGWDSGLLGLRVGKIETHALSVAFEHHF